MVIVPRAPAPPNATAEMLPPTPTSPAAAMMMPLFVNLDDHDQATPGLETPLKDISAASNEMGLFCEETVRMVTASSLSHADPTPMTPECTPVPPARPQSLSSPTCASCRQAIRDRYLLNVCDDYWHERCLCCAYCSMPLGRMQSCFIRDGKLFCKPDYHRIYSIKCSTCQLPVTPSDLVFRTSESIYHAQCFVCVYCQTALQKGDQYVLHDGQVICRRDYEFIVSNRVNHRGDSRKSPKRPRTILTSLQRKAFKESFNVSAKPCRKVRETLAKETGLSVRVVQVWFQNQRAKMKKVQRKDGDTSCSSAQKQRRDSDDEEEMCDDESTCSSDVVKVNNTFSEDDSMRASSADPAAGGCCHSDPVDSSPIGAPIEKLFNMQSNYFTY